MGYKHKDTEVIISAKEYAKLDVKDKMKHRPTTELSEEEKELEKNKGIKVPDIIIPPID